MSDAPRPVAIIGIIGGIAAPSTIEYYRLLHAGWARRFPGRGQARLIINSVDHEVVVGNANAGRWEVLSGYLVEELGRLHRAGASVALLASNTPHIAFDRIAAASPVPLISIVRATIQRLRADAVTRCLVLGTGWTLDSGLYQSSLGAVGITAVVPPPDERATLHQHYVEAFIPGRYEERTAEWVRQLIRDRCRIEDLHAVVLAGTELGLLLGRDHVGNIPLVDTTVCHVEAALAAANGR